jgi:hypothetical protein
MAPQLLAAHRTDPHCHGKRPALPEGGGSRTTEGNSIESNCCSVVRPTKMTANQSGSGFQFITHINEHTKPNWCRVQMTEPCNVNFSVEQSKIDEPNWCRVQMTEPCNVNFSVEQSKIDVPAHEYRRLSKFTKSCTFILFMYILEGLTIVLNELRWLA